MNFKIKKSVEIKANTYLNKYIGVQNVVKPLQQLIKALITDY